MSRLESWNDGAARQAVLDFVAKVTTPGSPDFVPPEARIATFDNDGTLWCEKPLYVQADFVLRRWKAMAAADPALAPSSRTRRWSRATGSGSARSSTTSPS